MSQASNHLAAPQQRVILIVDDNPVNLAMLSDYLREHDFIVLVARDGENGLQKAAYAQPNLILLDDRIPGIDSFEMCRRLKADTALCDIPIIIMTTPTDTRDKIEGLKTGAAGYITKPLQAEEVLARLETHLTLRYLQQELKAQKARLSQETAEREQAETALLRTRAELEQRVAERATELVKANAELQAEIAERQRVEAALREAELRYRTLFENTPVGIALVTQAGQVLEANTAWRQLTGYTEANLAEINAADVYQKLQDRAQFLERLQTKGHTRGFETTFKRKEGTPYQVSLTSNFIDMGGEQVSLTVIEDITERKQAEKVIAKRAIELEAVAKVSTTAATMLEVNQLLQTVVDLTQFSFKLYHVHIYLLNDPLTLEAESQGKALVLASGAGEVGQKMVAHGWQIPLDREQSLVARAARTWQGVIVNDVRADPSFLPNPLLPETRSEMAIPMIMGEQLLGVFDVQSDVVNYFSDEDIHIQTILAAQVAVALQNARQHEQAQMALAEQRRLAAELDNQRRTLEAILQNMPAGVFVAEAPSGKLLLTNEQAEAILGRDITLAIASTTDEPAEGYRAYLYGSNELYPTSQLPLVQARLGVTTRVDNMEIRRPDGQRILLEVAGAPIRNAQGQITASVAIFQDITERKQAEEALRHYAERLKDLRTIDQAILAAWSLEAIAESAIAHIRRLVPCLKASLILFDLEAGTFVVLAVHMNGETKIKPGQSYPFVASMVEKLQQGQVEVMEDISTLSPLPEPLQHLPTEGIRSFISVPLRAQSELIGSLNLFANRPEAFNEQDIEIASEVADQLAIAIKHARLYEQAQRQAAELEQRVMERTAQLAAANNELEAFSYSVSHDLRAPLRAIDGFSQALLEDYSEQLDEAGQDYLRRVRAATQRMGRLIDDLLELSRITRGELHRQQVNLSALISSLAWELRQTQLDRQVEFVVAPGVITQGDPHLLRIALENLLGNAWKFTQKQPQAIIEFGVIPHEGQLAYFVRDNGVGFDMNYAGKLFGPFQRLHARHEFEGTGIGLATVQRVIQRHGGRVWAEATVEKGAAFFFTLQ